MSEEELYDYEYEDVEEYDELETYAEESEEDWTVEDTCLTLGLGVGIVVIALVILKAIKKNFKNLNVKVGKVEINLETKDDSKKE